MNGHTFSNNDNRTFEPLPEGKYEAVIENIEKKTFKEKTGSHSGEDNIYLRLTYKIRDDQAQPLQYAGRLVSDNIFPAYSNEKRQFVQQDGWVDFSRLYKLLKTQEDFNDYKKDFNEGIEEFILFMMGKTLQINVGQRENEYNGETTIQNVVRGWSKTSLGTYHKKKNSIPENLQSAVESGVVDVIDDESLPF